MTTTNTTNAAPPAGAWYGAFTYSFDPNHRVMTRMLVDITGTTVKGKGTDMEGKYTIEGELLDGERVRFKKVYEHMKDVPMSHVAYVGTWDEKKRELAGRWRVCDTSTHGRFTLKPGKPEEIPEVASMSPEELFVRATRRFVDACTIDLELVRFDAEREMFSLLLGDPDFVKSVKEAKAAESMAGNQAARVKLHGRTRLSRATFPPPFVALDRCRKVLGLTTPVDLLVENHGAVNAFVETPPNGHIQITLTSGLINTLNEDETAYVIGHEIGHAILGHLETRVGSDMGLAGLTSLRRLALARYQEISADRMGLLCCPDVNIAMRAEFMLHSGVRLRDHVGSAEAIVKDAEQAVSEGEGKAEQVHEGYVTHPAGAFRTLATWWFAHSDTFAKLNGRPAHGTRDLVITESEMEQKVHALVSLMNPSILGESASSAEVNQLTALAALAVAEAHEGASDDEVKKIRDLGPEMGRMLDETRKLSFEERQIASLDLCEKLAMTMMPAARARIIEDLTLIANADGEISPPEQMVLDMMSIMLQVPPGGRGGANVMDELQLD